MATDRLRETNGWLVIRVIEFLGTITIRSALVSQLSFRVRRRASLELELVALRHQVTVLRRQRPGQLWLFSEEDQVPPIPGGPSVARHGNLSALGPHRLAALEQEKYLALMAELRRVTAAQATRNVIETADPTNLLILLAAPIIPADTSRHDTA